MQWTLELIIILRRCAAWFIVFIIILFLSSAVPAPCELSYVVGGCFICADSAASNTTVLSIIYSMLVSRFVRNVVCHFVFDRTLLRAGNMLLQHRNRPVSSLFGFSQFRLYCHFYFLSVFFLSCFNTSLVFSGWEQIFLYPAFVRYTGLGSVKILN